MEMTEDVLPPRMLGEGGARQLICLRQLEARSAQQAGLGTQAKAVMYIVLI
jgi:hypothetical protein